MKITKFVHSCLLVEMPAPVNRTALFDPGMMSEGALDVDKLQFLDDIFITHQHGDHLSTELMKKLVAKFPEVRITAPDDVVAQLEGEGITASSKAPEGLAFFDSPHESVEPLFEAPQQIGYHYLDLLSDPGDSHSFHETKSILALPTTGPWGSMVKAVNLALELQPKHIIPIHDWHWKDEALERMYGDLESYFKEKDITFHIMKTGEPIVIET